MSESVVKPTPSTAGTEPVVESRPAALASAPAPRIVPPPSVGATDLPANDDPAQQLADAAVHGILARHWNTLGIRPTMDLAELETTFYLMVEGFSRNPTEEEEAQRQEMQRSYAILRRALESRVPVSTPRFETPGLSSKQLAGLAVAAAIGLAALVYLNYGTIKLHMAEYDPDTVVRLAGKKEPYGTVIRFEPSHKFAVGEPTRAYQLKLSGTGEVVWLSERVVEKGMVPVK